ncbi:MAG TPA: hypothetical protein VIG47_12965, partial [Gemmatimonadaceae bacterium]
MSHTSVRSRICITNAPLEATPGPWRPNTRKTISLLKRTLLGCAVAAAALPQAARTAHAQAVNPGYLSGMRWRSIGPYRSGNVAGVTGIPGDPTTYYIATPEAGVWKTTNAGTTWLPVFDEAHVASVGAIAVAPSSPNTVYAGTG